MVGLPDSGRLFGSSELGVCSESSGISEPDLSSDASGSSESAGL